ncbi:MAG: hypothetical protein ACO295_05160 [Sediminibacterium sp.]
MEKIVNKNKQLKWDGWNVLHLTENEDGFFRKDGRFFDNKWHVQKTYEYKHGWEIPDNLVRDVQI